MGFLGMSISPAITSYLPAEMLFLVQGPFEISSLLHYLLVAGLSLYSCPATSWPNIFFLGHKTHYICVLVGLGFILTYLKYIAYRGCSGFYSRLLHWKQVPKIGMTVLFEKEYILYFGEKKEVCRTQMYL